MESYQTRAGVATGHVAKVRIEKPRLGMPVSLVVDDGVPCINPLYYFHRHIAPDKHGYVHEATIPLDLLEEFVDVTQRHGIRGKFTVLPYPAGLGTLLEEWEGFDRAEIERWLEITRKEIEPDFDITPEILTHTLALDLQDLTLIPEAEHIWMASRSEAELSVYMRTAVELLRQAGFAPTGITQPCYFHGDRAAYSNAVLAAYRPETPEPDGTVTFYFVDFQEGAPPLPPHPIVVLDRQQREAVVSILAYADDAFWNTQYPAANLTGMQAADELITADGKSGRLVELIEGNEWAVFVTHWQSIYANGKRHGLHGLDAVAARLARNFGPRLLWVTNSEIARYRVAEETTTITVADADTVRFDALFACADFTVSLPLTGDAGEIQGVDLVQQGSTLALTREPASDTLMASNSWRLSADGVTLCFNLQPGMQTVRLRR